MDCSDPCVFSCVCADRLCQRPRTGRIKKDAKKVLKWRDLVKLGNDYWWVAGVGGVFALARFSEAFLILRAEAVGIEIMWTPIVLVLMSLAFSLSAYPAGALSDRINRITVLGIGLGLLIAADLVIALVPGLPGLLVGVVLWGLHMGFTQGLFAALIADSAPVELRGTAFGMFNLLTGIALFIASVLAGLLWDVVGFQGTFLVGAGFAVLTAVGLVALKRKTTL